MNSQTLRILYAAGSGDVLGTYQHWRKNQDDPSQITVTYSGQFYEVCQKLGAKGYVISTHDQRTYFKDGQFTIEHRPKIRDAAGWLYPFQQTWYGLSLVFSALLWRANVLVAADSMAYWFTFALLPLFGIQVVPSIHCVPWKKNSPLRSSKKLLARLEALTLRRSPAVLVASHDIAEQVAQIVAPHPAKTIEFLPLYRSEQFTGIPAPDPQQQPFTILFIGRVEEDKGVFDLLEVARRLRLEQELPLHFDICGTGSALEALRAKAQQLNLDKSFVCHGYCHQPAIRERLGSSHIVIAPTRTTFVEGFCQVVAEGILAGRPVVTSGVCPALHYVRPGAVEVQPDQVAGYANAILQLYQNPALYAEKCQGCCEVQAQFYDVANSWGSVLKNLLSS